jgi:hypothetical protein
LGSVLLYLTTIEEAGDSWQWVAALLLWHVELCEESVEDDASWLFVQVASCLLRSLLFPPFFNSTTEVLGMPHTQYEFVNDKESH